MKCPLFRAACLMSPRLVKPKHSDCIKEKCGAWDEVEGGRCAIISLVGSLDDIATKLMYIADNTQGLKEVIGRG